MITTVHGRYKRPLTGAVLAFALMSLFSMQDALIKLLATDYALFQVLFIRSGVIIPLFFILVYSHCLSASLFMTALSGPLLGESTDLKRKLLTEIPTTILLAGSAIVVTCGLVIVQLERRQGPPGKIAH